MRGFLPVALALSLASLAFPADFRHATWGMTREQVVATEPQKPESVTEADGEVAIRYQPVQWGGDTVRVVYLFARNQLVRAKYIFDAEHAELNDFIADFRRVDPGLREQYGKPESDRAIWEDDSTQDERKSYLDQDRAVPANILPSDRNVGLAVSLGHLKLYTQWERGATRVLHALTGENGTVTHQVEYRSVRLAAMEDEVRGKAKAAR